MKLDRIHSPRLLAVALAALLPIGAAQATDLQETLKTLNPRAHATPDMKKSAAASSTMYAPPAQGTTPSGAQGPYRSEPPINTPQERDQYRYDTAPNPSPPVSEERSP